MSFSIRKRKSSETSQNYLASVADLMSGLLYVFILVLVIAMFRLQSATVKSGVGFVEYAQSMSDFGITSTKLVERLRDDLKERVSNKVEAQLQDGVLRIPEDVVSFEVGSDELDDDSRGNLNKISAELGRMLPCYIKGTSESPACRNVNPNGHTLEYVFIEGHTDNQPYYKDKNGKFNRLLSARRANAVYQVMVQGNAVLRNAKNTKGHPLFSLSGYGADRPVEGHYHAVPFDDQTNRRIELRFTFTQPTPPEELRKALKEHRDAE